MEMEAQDFFSNLDFDEMIYFYHITGKGNGKRIIENGLFMVDSKLSSTLNELKLTDLADVEDFIVKRGNQVLNNNDEMVIVGCYKEDVEHLVKKIKNEFVIDSEYIVGYIEIDENNLFHTIIINPNYIEIANLLPNVK